MNKKIIPFLFASTIVLAACGNVSSGMIHSSETSIPVSKSESVSSLIASSQSENSSSSTTDDGDNVVFTPVDAPAKESNTYPIGKTVVIKGVSFALEDIMAGNQQPIGSNGVNMTGIAVIQAKAYSGMLYNSSSFAIKSVKVTFIDKTSDYNTVWPVESVYGGDAVRPTAGKANGGEAIKSLSSTGYKQITQFFTFDKAVNFVAVANDSNSLGTDSDGRAVYFTSIEFNPLA